MNGFFITFRVSFAYIRKSLIQFPIRYYLITALFVLALQLSSFGQFKQETVTNDPIYTFKKSDRDGTGKDYMEKEISRIMNFKGMS